MITKNKKIVVGLSGGIDSSMALVLLKERGWQPIGVTLRLATWQDEKKPLRENACCTMGSINLAKELCRELKVPYCVLDIKKDFKKQVIGYFIKELKKGRTPNPCVICNRYSKFKKLLEFADKKGIKYVATGHYARLKLDPRSQKQQLLAAKDILKDQTYHLSFLSQKQLQGLVFPLGDLTKQEVYQSAKKRGLNKLVLKKESQDFCFVSAQSWNLFLEKEIGQKPGQIVDEAGHVLGKHLGLHFFTIGQRKGIGLAGGPFFVKTLDRKRNIVVVTQNKKQISQKEILLKPFNFISGEGLKNKILVRAKIRYQHRAASATLFPANKDYLKIVFDKPQIAVTPGQFCVFYNKNVCLGGGVIN